MCKDKKFCGNTCGVLFFAFLFYILQPGLAFGQELSGEEIIRRMENNQVHTTSRYEGMMEIQDRFGTRTKTFVAYSEGEEKLLLEFTSPTEAGRKILRVGDEVYLYFPEAEEIINLQGNALKDSVMGSDFSYEDLTREGGLLDEYQVQVTGREELDGRPMYVLELTAKNRMAVYAREKLWVDAEYFVLRRGEFYALSERLLRELITNDIRQIEGKYIAFYLEMSDKMRRDSRTIIRLQNLELGIELPPRIFSLGELRF